MPVVIKNSNYAFLKKVGVGDNVINALKAKGIKLSLGYKDFAFVSMHNEKLTHAVLPVSSNSLMKQIASTDEALVSLEILVKAALLAVDGHKGQVGVESAVPNLTSPVGSKMPDVVKVDPATVLDAEESSGADAFGVVPLREATKLYQKVRGTSEGSVYIVIAYNDAVKIAARITGTNISMRAEGSFTTEIRSKLSAQGLSIKKNTNAGEYASGHFECGSEVPVERVAGAVLVGLGIVFKTALPDMKMVRKLCS